MDDDSVPDNILFDLYRQYIGEPDAEIDVYLGFGLFFGGIALAFVGLLAFIYSGTLTYDSFAFWDWRSPAYILGLIALPTAMLGILVLLPIDARAIYTGVAGVAITFLAVIGFAIAHPFNFNVQSGADYSIPIVLLYGVGIAAVLASTGAALVAHQIQRHKPGPADIQPMEEEEPEESYTDEEIREDIDQAMSDVDITWGGVEKNEGTSLSLNIDEESIDTSGMNVEAKKVTSSSTDAQVQGLKALKGGNKKTQKSRSTVDDQTSKLTELKKRREKEQAEKEQAATQSDTSVVNKFKRLLGMS